MNLNTAKLTAILFNVGMIFVFARALLFPEVSAEWIFRGAFLIFIFEFLAVFTTAGVLKMKAASGVSVTSIKNTTLSLVVPCGFAVLFGYITGNLFAAGYFIVSTVVKLFDQKRNGKEADFVVAIVGILATLTIVVFTVPFWAALFPFSEQILSQKIEGTSGVFVDTPQTLLVWGVLYFSFMIWYELKRETVEAWLKRNETKHPRT